MFTCNVENRYVQKLPKIRVIESWNKVCTMTVIEVKDETVVRLSEREKGKKGKNLEGSRCRCYGGTDAFYGIAVQQMYGSNGASAGLPMGMTTLKSGGALGSLGTYGSALGSGVTGATTLPRPGNWLRPAGLRHGHSAARVRLYCQAK